MDNLTFVNSFFFVDSLLVPSSQCMFTFGACGISALTQLSPGYLCIQPCFSFSKITLCEFDNTAIANSIFDVSYSAASPLCTFTTSKFVYFVSAVEKELSHEYFFLFNLGLGFPLHFFPSLDLRWCVHTCSRLIKILSYRLDAVVYMKASIDQVHLMSVLMQHDRRA